MTSKKKSKSVANPTTTNYISQQIASQMEGVVESDEEDTSVNNVPTQSLGVRAQKKLISKLSSKSVAKVFIDDTSIRILDNLHKLIRNYSDSKKEADKLLKSIIKIIFKLGVLHKNDLFNEYELKLIDEFRNRFHSLAKSIVTFYEVDFTYDRVFLIRMCKECQDLTHRIISTHLTQKSHTRIDYVFNYLSNLQFIDYIFNTDSTNNRAIIKDIVTDMNSLMDAGLL